MAPLEHTKPAAQMEVGAVRPEEAQNMPGEHVEHSAADEIDDRLENEPMGHGLAAAADVVPLRQKNPAKEM